MRPIRLVISAFGPYANRTEIDLGSLGKSGIYLICGPTGAGKTSIFDAICYALFSYASGSVRDASMLRARGASPAVKTEVELDFIYKDKLYRVRRSPEYMRPKTKGDGLTKERASAELILPDGARVDGVNEVNAKIIELLGVDRSQFSQIAMIAQGDFQKLLIAPTDERKKIFQKIFNTDSFYRLQENLKQRYSELNDKCRELDASIAQYIAGVVQDGDGACEMPIAGMPYGEAVLAVEGLIEKDLAAFAECERAIGELAVKQSEHDARCEAEKRRAEARASFCEARQMLSSLGEKRVTLNEAYKIAVARESEITALSERIALARALLSDYGELEGLVNSLAKINDEQVALDKRIETLRDEVASTDGKIASDEQTVKEAGAANSRLLELAEEILGAEKIIEQCRRMTALLDEVADAEANAFILAEKYMRKRNEESAAAQKYSAVYRAYLDAQAGIIAKGLVAAEPCPVCGSTTHPAPCKLAESAPTAAEVDAAKDEHDIARRELSAVSAESGRAGGILDEKRQLASERADALFGDGWRGENSPEDALMAGELRAMTERKLCEHTELYTSLSHERTEKKAKADAGALAEARLDELKNKRVSLETDIKAGEVSLAELNAKRGATEKTKEQLRARLEYESKKDAEDAINSLQNTQKEIELAIDSAKNALVECENEIARQTGIAEQARALSEAPDATDADALMAEGLALDEQRRALTEAHLALHSKISANRTALSGLKSSLDKAEVLDKERVTAKLLYETAGGMLSGKEKMSLEAYVQGAFFDRIIARANTRLMVMSSGQYELVRRTEALGNRSQSGLELDVVDHFTASSRSVRTLSGGESFMASLSLALGLSDEIQSRSGGIQLDTLFVDEGFGTLDENTLEYALRALGELSVGGRLVGIISHVGELRQRIDKQLIVSKDKSGISHVKVCV